MYEYTLCFQMRVIHFTVKLEVYSLYLVCLEVTHIVFEWSLLLLLCFPVSPAEVFEGQCNPMDGTNVSLLKESMYSIS